jgi:cyclophilin family peptidyl-prolyl cis-trans isomerase
MEDVIEVRMRKTVQPQRWTTGRTKKTCRTNMKAERFCFVVILLIPIGLLCLAIYSRQLYSLTGGYGEQLQQQLQQQRHHVNHYSQTAQPVRRKRDAVPARIHTINENAIEEPNHSQLDTNQAPKTLILTTPLGPIHIQMRPDLSPESVAYVEQLVNSQTCDQCRLYRAERQGILQGIMENKAIPPNTVKGRCPKGAETIKNECFESNPQCACHGPLMSTGAVGWAAGTAGGPDFFIDAYPKTAKWWGTQHTNFGFIHDEASMNLVHEILQLPVKNRGGMNMLNQTIPFELSFA